MPDTAFSTLDTTSWNSMFMKCNTCVSFKCLSHNKNISEEKSLEILSIIYLSQTQTVSNCGWKYPQQNATNSFQIFSFKNVLGFCPVLYLENLFSQNNSCFILHFCPLWCCGSHFFCYFMNFIILYCLILLDIYVYIHIGCEIYIYASIHCLSHF